MPASGRTRATDAERFDASYEWRAVALLTLTFGLVGLDRFVLNPLFPAMMRDLHFDYGDLGIVTAVVAVAWGLGSILAGPLTDRYGFRRVMVPAIVVFSTFAGVTGLATGMLSLVAVRTLLGLSEGAFVPASISAAIDAAKPSRRGFVFGLQQNGLPLIGLGLGPILATQLLAWTGSWRWTFALVALPGLIMAVLIWRVVRDRPALAVVPAETRTANTWREALSYSNVRLAIAVMLCMAGALNVVLAMTPSYLVDRLGMTSQQMGFVASGIGLGACLGGLIVPALSDRLGRKRVMLVSAALTAAAMGAFIMSPPFPLQLFLSLTATTMFGFSVIYINIGPLTVESVPAPIASTAVGIVAGAGEIVGGGAAPVLAGYIADQAGLERAFLVALVAVAIGTLLIFVIREPARPAVSRISG